MLKQILIYCGAVCLISFLVFVMLFATKTGHYMSIIRNFSGFVFGVSLILTAILLRQYRKDKDS